MGSGISSLFPHIDENVFENDEELVQIYKELSFMKRHLAKHDCTLLLGERKKMFKNNDNIIKTLTSRTKHQLGLVLEHNLGLSLKDIDALGNCGRVLGFLFTGR